MAISMLKIRRPLGRLIFNMGIAIPGKTVFLIETAPWPHGEICKYTYMLNKKQANLGTICLEKQLTHIPTRLQVDKTMVSRTYVYKGDVSFLDPD